MKLKGSFFFGVSLFENEGVIEPKSMAKVDNIPQEYVIAILRKYLSETEANYKLP